MGNCFATRAECAIVIAETAEAVCRRQPVAFCKLACTPELAGAPYCREVCRVDEVACDNVEEMTSTACNPMKPPSNAALFPDFSAPGWWCWGPGSDSAAPSRCVKGRERCEWHASDGANAAGTASARCVARQEVVCFPRQVGRFVDQVCAPSQTDCESLRGADDQGSTCAPWKHDEAARKRVVPRPAVEWAPSSTLVFDIDDGNTDVVRTVKLVRDRVNVRGIAAVAVRREGDAVAVHVPSLDADNEERLVEIVTREMPWTIHRVRSKHSAARALAAWSNTEPSAAPLGVQSLVDGFGSPYLRAANRDVRMLVREAKKRGCWTRYMPVRDGEVECWVPGRDVLAELVEVFAATLPDPDEPVDYLVGYEFIHGNGDERDYWRTHHLERVPTLTSRDLDWAWVGWALELDTPLVTLRWSAAARTTLDALLAEGAWLAIMFEGRRVGTIIRPARRPAGQDIMIIRPDSRSRTGLAGEYQDMEELVTMLRAGLPMGVSFNPAPP